MCQLKAIGQEGSSTHGRVRLLGLVRPSNACVRPTHMGEVLCCTQFAELPVNLSKNTFTDMPRTMFDQISGRP